jgi:hypothetical protein
LAKKKDKDTRQKPEKPVGVEPDIRAGAVA